ncbi:MAG: TonB-dependent receptor plug domain-containing protein, partial [Bacteroidota bacterium]
MITTRCIFLTVLGLLSMVAWAQERPDQSSLDTLNWDEIRYAAFHSDTISMENWRSFSLPVNTMVDSRAGVRVRQNAATGSNFSYELDGLNSVSYFLDGLPIRYMGSAMQINNMPTALLDKVEVFKGVTPVYLGSDGLGGTVNMVTRKVDSSFISASYAYGSFNTQQAHLQGQWTNKRSGFTVKAMTYFTDAENNYEIDVDVPNQTGFIERISAERFNDDFRSLFGKIDLGFTNVSWADELFVGLVVSDLEEGIQTGSDLAIPLGDVQRDEEFLMPAITYKKNDIFVKGLSLDLFGSYAMTKRTFTDTSSFVYNWRGERILTRAFPGELVNGGSLNEVEDKALIVRVFPQFQFSDDHKIVLNYTLEDLERESEDEFNPLPFSSEPTKYTTHTAGLGWQGNWLQGRLYSNLFAKYFRFNSSATQMAFAGSQELEGDDSQVGFGLATSYKI